MIGVEKNSEKTNTNGDTVRLKYTEYGVLLLLLL